MTEKTSVCGVAQRGELFLVARRKPGGSQGGKWEFPGGKLEPGEDAPSALRREFLEELSVNVRVGSLLGVTGFRNGSTSYRLEAWAVEIEDPSFVLLEHETTVWAKLNDVIALDLSDSDRDVAILLQNRLRMETARFL